MNWLTDFFKGERKALLNYARRKIDDMADRDAEDIVQDVFVSLFEKADVTLPIENLAAYVYQSLRNRIVDIFRKKKDTLSLEDIFVEAQDNTEDEVVKKEMLDRLFDAVSRLSDGEKAVILANEFDGRPFKELAAEWNVPLGTLLARKSRAVDKLRKQLTGEFGNI